MAAVTEGGRGEERGRERGGEKGRERGGVRGVSNEHVLDRIFNDFCIGK